MTKKLTGSAEDEKREENRHIPVSRNRDSEATAAASCDILFCSDSLTKNEKEDIKKWAGILPFFWCVSVEREKKGRCDDEDEDVDT